MDWHGLLVFAHILTFVFWLGTDIGVFVIGKFAQNPAFSGDQRLLLLKILVIVDKFPRFSMVFTLATGLQLAQNLNAISLSNGVIVGMWMIILLWFVVVLIRHTREEGAVPVWVFAVEKLISISLLLLIGGAAIASILGKGPILFSWLAWKALLFAGIFLAALLLERAFMPALQGFTALATTGSSAEVEQQIRKGMDGTYLWVICIYLFVFFAAMLGVLKPVF